MSGTETIAEPVSQVLWRG